MEMTTSKKILSTVKNNFMLFVLVIVYLAFMIATGGKIFEPNQFHSLINQNAYVYILACGMLMCMLTGGNIDLACGSFVCFLGALGGYFLSTKALGTGVSIVLMLVVAAVYGIVIAYIIAYVNVPPWIATLAGYLAFRGLGTQFLSNVSTQGSINISAQKGFLSIFSGKIFNTKPGTLNTVCFTVAIIAAIIVVAMNIWTRAKRLKKGYEADTFAKMITKSVIEAAVIILLGYKFAMAGGIPTVLVWVIGIVLIYSFITEKTTTGRYFYVVGGNRDAAFLSGVNTKKIMFLAYLNMAILTAVATCIVLSRYQAANSTAGTNFEMDAIAACVVGGVSAYGGEGKVFGMVIGATLIGVINLGMSLLSWDSDWQKVVKGIVLLGAVVFEILSKKRAK